MCVALPLLGAWRRRQWEGEAEEVIAASPTVAAVAAARSRGDRPVRVSYASWVGASWRHHGAQRGEQPRGLHRPGFIAIAARAAWCCRRPAPFHTSGFGRGVRAERCYGWRCWRRGMPTPMRASARRTHVAGRALPHPSSRGAVAAAAA